MMKEAAQMQQSREISEMRAKGKENRYMYDGNHDALDDDSGIAMSPSRNANKVSYRATEKCLTPKLSDGSPKTSCSARPVSKIPRMMQKDLASPTYTNVPCVRALNTLEFGRTVTLLKSQSNQ